MSKRRPTVVVVAFAALFPLWASAAAGSTAGDAGPSPLASVRSPAHSPRHVNVAPTAADRSNCEASDVESSSGLQALVLGVTY
jgi:hypothetical protein